MNNSNGLVKNNNHSIGHIFQQGLTLIELLVSMLIASIVFGGVVAVVQTSRSNYSSEQESAFMQENTRFAIELLSRDIRMAGSMGCAQRDSSAVGSVLGGAATETESNLGGLIDIENSLGLMGYEGTVVEDFPSAIFQTGNFGDGDNDSDAIMLRYANPDPRMMEQVSSHSGSVITVDGAHDFKQGDKIVVVDAACRNVGIFQHSSNATDTLQHAASGRYPGNCAGEIYSNDSFSCLTLENKSSNSKFKRGSFVYPYVAHAYFIDGSNVVPGVPALKRTVMNATGARPEELAQGIEHLNFEYGVDSDDDGDVNSFVTADNVTDWADVLAVKFSIILRSQTETLADPKVVTIDGIDFNDRYMRQLVNGTIALRNE